LSRHGEAAEPSYSLQIPLPDEIDRAFRRWVAATPGATWPEEGGHVTVLPPVVPLRGLEPLEAAIAGVCADWRPFRLELSRLVRAPHLAHPPLHTVLLAEPAAAARRSQLHGLRRALLSALRPVARDLSPAYTRRPYRPHITLTLGVDRSAAAGLAEAAAAAGLRAVLAVDALWLRAYRGPRLDPTGSRRFPIAG
jgi:hypothetical protein